MFGSFLMDQGVEMELDADLGEVVKTLDREVPGFKCDGYGFRLNVTKGVMGSQWRFLVNPVDGKTRKALDTLVGIVIVTRQEDGTTTLNIPPRSEWAGPETEEFDADGRLFIGFVLEVLRAFQRLGWVDLPGVLPEI